MCPCVPRIREDATRTKMQEADGNNEKARIRENERTREREEDENRGMRGGHVHGTTTSPKACQDTKHVHVFQRMSVCPNVRACVPKHRMSMCPNARPCLPTYVHVLQSVHTCSNDHVFQRTSTYVHVFREEGSWFSNQLKARHCKLTRDFNIKRIIYKVGILTI